MIRRTFFLHSVRYFFNEYKRKIVDIKYMYIYNESRKENKKRIKCIRKKRIKIKIRE